MTIEESLRAYILNKYCSMNNFCNEIGLLPQTMSAIFKRGIKTCSSGILFKISDALDISIDSLKDGKIEPRIKSEKYIVNVDYLADFLDTHCIIETNKKPLTTRDLARFYSYLEFSCELLRRNQKGEETYPIMASLPEYEDDKNNESE